MRGCEVELTVIPWAYDRAAENGEDAVLIAGEWVKVDGRFVERGHDRGGTGARLPCRCELSCHDFLRLKVEDPPVWLRERYQAPSDHLMGSTFDRGADNVLYLSVRALAVVETPRPRRLVALA